MEELDVTNVSLDEIVKHNNQHLIKENLRNIKFTRSKLQQAQEVFYGQGKSPLTRNTLNDSSKAPVHSRLGKRTKFRPIPIGLTTDTIMPKARLRLAKNNINSRGNNGRILRLHRGGIAQQRIEKIRRQQADAMSSQLVQPLSKFRLRKRIFNGIGGYPSSPINFTVEVPNNTCMNNQVMHSVQESLNSNIEVEIDRIQALHMHPPMDIQMLPGLPLNTTITLDERFSSLV